MHTAHTTTLYLLETNELQSHINLLHKFHKQKSQSFIATNVYQINAVSHT